MSNHDELMKALKKHYEPISELRGEPRPGAAFCGFKEIHSESLGVHPSQVEEAKAAAKKHGVPVEFDHKSRPIFTCKSQRKKYCEKVRASYDMDGGYGDPQPQGKFKETTVNAEE